MDTHTFDGQLLDIKAQILPYLEMAAAISKEDKLVAFKKLGTCIQSNSNFDTIVNDFQNLGHSNGPNYDPTNGLYADDLLYLCSKMTHNEALISLLNEQLIHMSTGMCPQGRTHRLIQLAIPFLEFIKQ